MWRGEKQPLDSRPDAHIRLLQEPNAGAYWPTRKILARHLPLAIGACSLIVAVYVGDETVRAIVAVGSILLMIYQYLVYRKASKGSRLVFLTIFPLEVGLLSAWLALNVARAYTYEPETASTWAWHERLIDLQDLLSWAVAVLGAISLTWMLLRFTRWLRGILRTHASAA